MTTALDILNKIREEAGVSYSNDIPEATRENITQVGNTLVGNNANNPHFNTFFSNLVNRIGRTLVEKMPRMDDIYSMFTIQQLELGDTIQKIYIELPKAKAYDGTATTSMLAQDRGTIHVEYTRVDRKIFYKKTITIAEIREAFVSLRALQDFITALIESMRDALVYDIYIMLSETFRQHCLYELQANSDDKSGVMLKVPSEVAVYNPETKVIEWETTGAKQFLKLVRRATRSLKFPHEISYFSGNNEDGYELAGTISKQRTPVPSQVMGLEVDTLAEIDVDALAVLFHLEPAQLETKVIELENGILGQVEVNGTNYYIGGFITDKDAVERYTTLEDTDSFKNPESKAVNYWLHWWGLIAISKFKDFVPIVFSVKEE